MSQLQIPESRTRVLTAALMCLLMVVPRPAAALSISSYYSPRNRERPLRKSTYYIVLHTTEGPKAGSLNKVRANGETHYFVDTTGHVYRIIDRRRVALHAGRSMWNGRSNLDNCSIGIEVVGYHNQDITAAQCSAVKSLLEQLQKIYRVPDDRVLTHSMIAYGAPNRWHRRSHRGRKRCGMLFASRPVRKKIGLTRKPAYDPDVKAGRLVVADPYLAKVLYSKEESSSSGSAYSSGKASNVIAANRTAWDIAREKYRSASTIYEFPDGRKFKGTEITNWTKIPAGTQVILGTGSHENEPEVLKAIGVDGESAQDIAGDEAGAKTTIYFIPDGSVKTGADLSEAQFKALPQKTRVLVGYTHGGGITAKRSAFDVCGKRWNFPSTFYRFPDGRIVPGNEVRETAIPKDTQVFFRN